MLIEFSVENFRSFAEKQTLSMVAGSGKEHPENLIEYKKTHLLKSAAIFGANAAGKSNLVKAMSTMSNFVRTSATTVDIGGAIPGVVPFRLHTAWRGKPSRFEVDMVHEDKRYVYGFSATESRIHEEWLYEFPLGSKRRVFEREHDSQTGGYNWAWGQSLKSEERKILRDRTRENCLALSRGADMNIEALNPAYFWFEDMLLSEGLAYGHQLYVFGTALWMSDKPEILERVGELLRDADIGIERIAIKKREKSVKVPLSEVFAEVGPRLLSKYYFVTTHRTSDSLEDVKFDMVADESVGSQRFLSFLGPLLGALETGAVFFVDELEASMHPNLVRKLVQLFQSPERNNKGAQLVFTTHSSDLMDQNLFRRDQIWLVDKNSSGASELVSLYDFVRPRKGAVLRKRYLEGRYGGIPQFGRIFEDLEFE